MKKLENKVIVITGAAMGLGYATALEAAKNGAQLSLIDYNAESLEKAKATIQTQYPDVQVLTTVADVSDEAAVKNYVDGTVSTFGRIDGFTTMPV